MQCIQNILDLAMPILRESPNVVTLPRPEGAQRVLVVGDLHGSLADLHHIFEQNGWPSEENVYIFNGDFVDRGLFGLEVLMVLLACKGISDSLASADGLLQWHSQARSFSTGVITKTGCCARLMDFTRRCLQ